MVPAADVAARRLHEHSKPHLSLDDQDGAFVRTKSSIQHLPGVDAAGVGRGNAWARQSLGRRCRLSTTDELLPNSAAYTTSKHGVLGLTRALAAELGKDGVRVNAIGPGMIETRINAEARAKNPDMVANVMRHTPLGRPGKPEDIAGPAVFLASDLSSYVTGSIVMADGGFRSI